MAYVRHFTLTCGLVMIWLCSLPALVQDDDDDKEEAALRSAIKKAQTPGKSATAYRKFFDHYEKGRANGTFYKSMCSDTDNIIALQAAYRVMTKKPNPPELAHHRHFIGFVEGRTGLTVPDEWRWSLICHVSREHPEIGLVDKELKRIPKQIEKRNSRMEVKKPVKAEGFILENLNSIERRTEQVILKTEFGFREVSIPEKLFQQLTDSVKHYEVKQMHMWLEADHVFFLLNDIALANEEKPFVLFCISNKEKKLLWKAPLWVWVFRGISGPGAAAICEAEIAVSKQGNTIGTFLRLNGALCMEGFDLRDGSTKFRFSSDMWSFAGK
jgi:hypothetical protein